MFLYINISSLFEIVLKKKNGRGVDYKSSV